MNNWKQFILSCTWDKNINNNLFTLNNSGNEWDSDFRYTNFKVTLKNYKKKQKIKFNMMRKYSISAYRPTTFLLYKIGITGHFRLPPRSPDFTT